MTHSLYLSRHTTILTNNIIIMCTSCIHDSPITQTYVTCYSPEDLHHNKLANPILIKSSSSQWSNASHKTETPSTTNIPSKSTNKANHVNNKLKYCNYNRICIVQKDTNCTKNPPKSHPKRILYIKKVLSQI